MDYQEFDTRTLAVALDANRAEQAALRLAATEMEGELYARIQANGGTALMDDDFTIELKQGTPSYDYSVLAPLKEVLPSDVLDKAYSPPTTKTVEVPEKWNGQQLNSIEHKFGADVAARIRDARIPGPASLVVARKLAIEGAK
jgi:hypothetical protein